MSRKTLIIFLLILTVSGVYLWPKSKTVDAVQIQQDKLLQSIVATGRISPPAKIELASLVNANIEQILVTEGDFISQGDLLVKLNDPIVIASLQQAEASLVEARQKLIEANHLSLPLAQYALEQTITNVAIAKSDYQRNKELFDKKLLSPSALEQAKRTLDNAQSAHQTAQLQLNANLPKGSNLDLLQTRIQQAQASLNLAKAKAQQLTLLSPVNGRVLIKHSEIGDIAQVGKSLLTLSVNGDTQIEVPIDEKSIRFIKQNQIATVIADAYPNQSFNARVNFIYPSIDANKATVMVKLIVDQPPSFLLPDMTVSIEITVDEVANALIVPTDAIYDLSSKQPWIITIRNGKSEKQTVKLGLQGVGHTQIISDQLTTGDWVITQRNIDLHKKVIPKERVMPTQHGFDVPNGFR